MGVAAKTHWEGAYEALFGLKQISIEELGTGTKCFKCAIMAFDMGTFMSDELTTDQNLNLHHVLSSFRSWAFARLPLADHVHDSRRLSVINRSNWRQLLNGDKIVSMAKSQGWQAQVSPAGDFVSWEGLPEQGTQRHCTKEMIFGMYGSTAVVRC